MAGGVKGAIAQTAIDVHEAAVKPVAEEVGRAIEQGLSTAIKGPGATTVSPQEMEKKRAEEQKRKMWAQRVIKWYKDIEEAQRRVRESQQQRMAQSKQEEEQKKQVRQFKIIEKQKKKEDVGVKMAARKVELRGGVGG